MKLTRATPEEAIARDRLSYDAWGTPLEPDDWVERERRLRAHVWAQEALTSYLLKGDDGEVLASCEAYRVQSRFRGVPGWSFAIASVYTESRLRGQGHASTMMRLLNEEFMRIEPRLQAATLYSDVGPRIYERAGYRATSGLDLVFQPAAGDPAAAVDRLIRAQDLWTEHARVPQPDAEFLIFPSANECDWHLERERIYAQFLGRPALPTAGARAGDGTIFWMANHRDGKLKVLLLSAARGEEARALMTAAQRIAHQVGLSAVQLWEHPRPLGFEHVFTDAVRQPREGALPMLCPFVPALGVEHWTWITRGIWV
ncbi:MAG TPA: N-acetyltransferase [Polyangia bacterium]|jgi:hypothetical protein|nr:N-acetyltransferase [Polyangia bacterium]